MDHFSVSGFISRFLFSLRLTANIVHASPVTSVFTYGYQLLLNLYDKLKLLLIHTYSAFTGADFCQVSALVKYTRTKPSPSFSFTQIDKNWCGYRLALQPIMAGFADNDHAMLRMWAYKRCQSVPKYLQI